MPAKKPVYVVVNPSLYFRVDGKLKELPVGSEISLTQKQAENMVNRGWVKPLGEPVKVDAEEK